MEQSQRHYLALCAIVRDETPFLREWVAYHHYIGFEKIYIYDNQSAIPVRDTLLDFIEGGICETRSLQGEAMQSIAYNLCLRDYGPSCEWLAFFDLDEFLCLKNETDARVLLRDYEDYSCLMVHWDSFSSSGHLTHPQGLVMHNYTQSLGYSPTSKSIVRPSKVKMTLSAHHFMLNEGRAVNTNEEPAIRNYTPLAVDKVCLNHYRYRSQQDYAGKMEKADATYGLENPRKWEKFYSQAEKLVVERTDILPVADEIKWRLEKNQFSLRNEVVLHDTIKMPLPQILTTMAKVIHLSHAELAEVIFALSYKRFAKQWAFVEFGVRLCLQVEKFERAIALTQEWLAYSPGKEGYLLLFESYLVWGQQENSEYLYNYLAETADIIEGIEKIENPESPSLKESLSVLVNKYSFKVMEML